MISVDTKKKELIGATPTGAGLAPPGDPERVDVHDFPIGELPKAIPMGSSTSATTKAGCRSATSPTPPSSRSTPSAAGGTPRAPSRSPRRPRSTVTADAGGSNGYRVKPGKAPRRPRRRDRPHHHRVPLPARHIEVEQDRTPLFSFISMNWRGRPSPHTAPSSSSSAGPPPRPVSPSSRLLRQLVPQTGIKITDAEFATFPLSRHDWHGEWNYRISPDHPRA